jgi:hypothetical protein
MASLIILYPFIQYQVKSVHHFIDELASILMCHLGELGIEGSGFGAFVPHLMLNGSQINTHLHQMSTVTMAQCVWGGGFADATIFSDRFEGSLQPASIHDLGGGVAEFCGFPSREQ